MKEQKKAHDTSWTITSRKVLWIRSLLHGVRLRGLLLHVQCHLYIGSNPGVMISSCSIHHVSVSFHINLSKQAFFLRKVLRTLRLEVP